MAKYALVENGQIKDVADALPLSWRNVSNFNSFENQYEALASFGWVEVVKEDITINPHTQVLSQPSYTIMEDGRVLQSHTAEDKVVPEVRPVSDANRWFVVRKKRDALMDAMSFRYERYNRRERLGIEQIDRLADMDAYMQALADITSQNIDTILWPVYTPSA